MRMGVYRFEDLRVWQAAKEQSDRVGELLQRPAFQRDRELSGQMNDAALSVLFNIAEGFLRRKDGETAQFLRYAFASNGELKSAYYAATGRRYLTETDAADLIRLNESIAKMLRRWQGTLKPGDSNRDRSGNESRTKRSDPGKHGPKGRRSPSQDEGPGRTKDQGRTTDQGDQGPSTKAQGPS
jgi:four helix bundle protein